MESAAEQEVQELPRRVSLNSSCSKKSLCGTFPEDVTPQRRKHFGHLVLTFTPCDPLVFAEQQGQEDEVGFRACF